MAKLVGRERRKLRIRKKISGTAERPRLSVFRSAKHIYAQVIDDTSGTTLAHASTLSKDAKLDGTKSDDAKAVGKLIADLCKKKNVTKGEMIGSFLFQIAQMSSMIRAKPPCAMPIVTKDACFCRPREKTSSGSVPSLASMKQQAPKEKRRQPAR